VRIDLHLHSKHSKRPSEWFLKKIGCPESFSEPEYLYELTRRKGMTAFTLTDHNTIDGCLELAHRPGVFISEEVTTYFPEDGCKAHVLVWNIDPAGHEDIQKIRDNIFTLVAYLQQHEIPHALAHPLLSINGKLTVEHFEKFLLLFRHFELNGAREEGHNQILWAVLAGLGPEVIERLRRKHKIMPAFARPWQKFLVGGSDDHSGLNATRIHTQVSGVKTAAGFFSGLAEGRAIPIGTGSGPRTMAHTLYSIAYQFYDHKFQIRRYAPHNGLIRLVDHLLNPRSEANGRFLSRLKGLWPQRRRSGRGNPGDLIEVLRLESEKLIARDRSLAAWARQGLDSIHDRDMKWYDFLNRLTSIMLARCLDEARERLFQANPFNLLPSLSALGCLYFLLAPYFFAYGLFARGREMVEEISQAFPVRQEPAGPEKRARVALFTDSLYDQNRVAALIRRQAEAAERLDLDLSVITCQPQAPERLGRVRNFEPIGVYQAAERPGGKLLFPPLLSMLHEVYEQGFSHLHAATPGPVGLAAVVIARIMNLPLIGSYQPGVHQMIGQVAGDEAIEQLSWRFFARYYNQMDLVLAPSEAGRLELMEKGVAPERIQVLPAQSGPKGFDQARVQGFGSSPDQRPERRAAEAAAAEEAFLQLWDIYQAAESAARTSRPHSPGYRSAL